jgi:hypothetical protein
VTGRDDVVSVRLHAVGAVATHVLEEKIYQNLNIFQVYLS